MDRHIKDANKVSGASAGRKGSVFPEQVETKEMHSANMGEGRMLNYPDMEELVLRDQHEGMRKIGSHKMKAGYRN